MDNYPPQLLWNKKTFSWLLRIVWRHRGTKSNRWADVERNVRTSRPSAVHLLNKTVQCHIFLKRFRNFYIMPLRWMLFVVFCFCYCNFVSSFTPPSFLCTLIFSFSFSFLLGCCVILTSEVPSALTGEAAGELGCIECQAASMFKAEGEEEKTERKNPTVLWRVFGSSSNFLQGRWLQEENCLQGTRDLPSRNCHFHF